MSEQAANEKKWNECTGKDVAWIGLDVPMDIKEIADWLDALVESGGCGFGSGDAFGDSSNSLATWMSSLADKIRKMDSSRSLRDCDVETAEEQNVRIDESVCSKYHECVDCPYYSEDCSLVWAQMPYEARKDDGKNGNE